jgi:hypothetical protein
MTYAALRELAVTVTDRVFELIQATVPSKFKLIFDGFRLNRDFQQRLWSGAGLQYGRAHVQVVKATERRERHGSDTRIEICKYETKNVFMGIIDRVQRKFFYFYVF